MISVNAEAPCAGFALGRPSSCAVSFSLSFCFANVVLLATITTVRALAGGRAEEQTPACLLCCCRRRPQQRPPLCAAHHQPANGRSTASRRPRASAASHTSAALPIVLSLRPHASATVTRDPIGPNSFGFFCNANTSHTREYERSQLSKSEFPN